jgi:hypothetical protein
MSERYGVPEAPLQYVRVPDGDPVAPVVEAIEQHRDGASLDGAREALRSSSTRAGNTSRG